LRENKSNRKPIEIGYLFGLTHHNIFDLFNGQRRLLVKAEKRLLSLFFQYLINDRDTNNKKALSSLVAAL
jgi:hypothetical protein